MNQYKKCAILTSVIVLSLFGGACSEAKGIPTRTTTDPAITEKAIHEQMENAAPAKQVNFDNMLLQKNAGSLVPDVTAPEGQSLDIDLKSAVTTALQNNRDITLAEIQRDTAAARISQAAAAKNPTVSNTWSAARSKNGSSKTFSTSFTPDISVNWPIWTGGAAEGALNEARYNKSIQDLEVYRTEAATKLSAVTAYYRLLEDINLADVQAESVNDYANHLKNVQQQFDAGIVAKLDVLTTNVSLANAKQQKIAADNNRDIAEANLNNIMRIPMNTKLNPVNKNFPEPEFDITLDQAIAIAEKYRWELVEADYNVKVAQEALRVAKAGYMPTVSVSGGYNWNDDEFAGFKNQGWQVRGGLSWNIWDGGSTQAQIKEAKEGIRQAQENLLRSRESVELEVRQDYLNILAAKEQIRASEASVDEAEEAYKIATVRYASGVGINLDVLDAQLQLNTARTNHITALYDYNVDLATLENAMGIPAVIHKAPAGEETSKK